MATSISNKYSLSELCQAFHKNSPLFSPSATEMLRNENQSNKQVSANNPIY
jgi:hypothetical protein